MDSIFRKLMLLFAASFFMLHEALAAPTTDGQESGNLNGKLLIEIGNKVHSPLLRLIGKTFKNIENNIKESVRSEKSVIDEICRLHPCSQWSEWSKCDATALGEFGSQTRIRSCELNTTLCKRNGDIRDEYDYKICESTCPDDYSFTNHGFCLKLYADLKKSRDDAEEICRKDKGHLVNVDSFEKVHDVNETLEKQSYTNDKLWIDGRRYVQGGPWEYGYKPSDPSFTFWGNDDPDNGASDLCMRYFKHSIHGFSWRKFDFFCTDKYGFMCEIII